MDKNNVKSPHKRVHTVPDPEARVGIRPTEKAIFCDHCGNPNAKLIDETMCLCEPCYIKYDKQNNASEEHDSKMEKLSPIENEAGDKTTNCAKCNTPLQTDRIYNFGLGGDYVGKDLCESCYRSESRLNDFRRDKPKMIIPKCIDCESETPSMSGIFVSKDGVRCKVCELKRETRAVIEKENSTPLTDLIDTVLSAYDAREAQRKATAARNIECLESVWYVINDTLANREKHNVTIDGYVTDNTMCVLKEKGYDIEVEAVSHTNLYTISW